MSEQTVRKSKWGKVAKVMLIFGTVLLCLFGLAYSLTDIGEAASGFDKNREAAKKLGLPFSAADMDRLRAVPDEDNAAVILGPMLDRIAEVTKKYDYKDFNVFAKANWSKIAADFPLVAQASRKKTLIFKRDWRDPFSLVTPEYVNIRYWTRFLVEEAKVAADHGNRTLAVQYLSTAARLGMLIDKDQDFVALGRRQGTVTMIQTELKRWVPMHGKDPEWRTSILEVLDIIDQPYDLRPCFRTMHWQSLYAAEVIVGGRKDTRPQTEIDYPQDVFPNMDSMKSEAKWFKVLPRFGMASLSRIDEYYALVLTNYPSDLYDFTALDALAKKTEAFMDMTRFGWRLGLSLRICEYVIPMYTLDYGKGFHREYAQTSLLRQALALLDSGKSPSVHRHDIVTT